MHRAMSRALWAPPPVSRHPPNSSVTRALYELGVHFHLLTREHGSERHDLPIWHPAPGAVPFDAEPAGEIVKHAVEGVPGAFTLSNVLSDGECEALISLSEAMGYTPDAPVSLGRNVRQNENCVIIADTSLDGPIWQRVAQHMPPAVAGGRPMGLNRRWRLYKYAEDDVFRMHTDGSWPGSGVGPNGRLVRDLFGDRWSQLTFLIYLDGDYEGGETTFFVNQPPPAPRNQGELVSVRVPRGSVLCFFHGEHPLSLLHEGSLVKRGVKRIVRSDVLYSLPGAADAQANCPAE